MTDSVEPIHLPEYADEYNMPYTAALKVHSGNLVFISGITAAPLYHHHPHRSEEFDAIPADAGEQARMVMETLQQILHASGCKLEDVVSVTRYIRDVALNQDAINRVAGAFLGTHRPTSTTVEVVRMATDPRIKFEMSAVAVAPE